MPAIPATRAIPALRITTALTITPDRRPPAPAAAQARRAVLQAPRIPVRLVRRHPVRRHPVRRHLARRRLVRRPPAPAPVLRALQARRIAQAPVRRPDQVTARRRNPPRHRIQAAGLHNKLCAHLRAGLQETEHLRACSNLPPAKSPQPRCSILLCVQSESILEQKPPEPDLRFPYGQDPNQFVDARFPAGKGPHPIVFFIHGGYWRAKYDLTYAGHLCHALAKAGIATWNVEYRRVGNPGGGWPGTFADIRSAYRALREHKNDSIARLDLKKLCIAGHSAGGHLALCLAGFERSVTHVLSLAGVLDLHRAWELHLSNDAAAAFLGGSPSEVPDHYREASPAERSIPQAVQKLIHGTQDEDVPYEISQSYATKKKKTGENVELSLEAGGKHIHRAHATLIDASREQNES